jgi:hypothetical protein
VLNTLTEKRNNVGTVAPPDSPSGFQTSDKITATATFTAPALGAGSPCIFVLKPDPFLNVIPRVNDKDATRLPEGGPIVINEDETDPTKARLLKVCPGDSAEKRTVSINITLNDWYPELGRTDTQGTVLYTLNYVNLVQDQEGQTVGQDGNALCGSASNPCVALLTGSVDTVGVTAKGSQCPDLGAFGTGAGGTGCPLAQKSTVTLHTVNLGGGASTDVPLPGIQVKVFDRNSTDFQAYVAKLTGKTMPCAPCKNPDGSLYGLIFEGTANNDTIVLNTSRALVGSSITSSGKINPADAGVGYAGLRTGGDFLAIVKFVDPTNGATVYVGRPFGLADFNDTTKIATKEFQIIKTIKKDGSVDWRGGNKTVVTGSLLEIVAPDGAVWENDTSIYPFIFTSDSDWSVDVCQSVPHGYELVGVYDENGLLSTTSQCVQTVVASQRKVIAFEVRDVGSPEPSMKATVKVKDPRGRNTTKNVDVSDIRRHTFDGVMRGIKLERGPQHGPTHGH